MADVDDDGLPDGLEDYLDRSGLKDPDGRVLPNLNAMGAASSLRQLHPDIFVEVNAMWAATGHDLRLAQHPFSPTEPFRKDLVGHHHMPTPEDLKMVGDAFAARGITVHFDVGDLAAYHALGVVHHFDWEDDYTSTGGRRLSGARPLSRGEASSSRRSGA